MTTKTERFESLPTRIAGPKLIAPRVFGDSRGFFSESYRRNELAELGIGEEFVQDNHSRSSQGVLRGMHFQVGAGMSKLVRVSRGRIVDVVVDLRRGSPWFGQWEAFEISDENHHQVYCPIGFAHGFVVLSDIADVNYKCSGYYDGSIERGITFADPAVGIAWPTDVELLTSERDASAPLLADIAAELPFEYAG